MIIPALDILDNKIVRLYQGKYDTVQFYPFELSERLQYYTSQGAQKIHLVDLEGARDPSNHQWKYIQKSLNKLNKPFQIGGGLRTRSDIAHWFDAGASQLVIGSMAVEKRNEVSQWITQWGSDKWVIALDVNQTEKGWQPATHGWTKKSPFTLSELIRFYREQGVNDFLCTDIHKDGTMKGPSLSLYYDLLNEFPGIHLQASGGVSSLDDIKALKELGVSGIILGKSLLEGLFTVNEAIHHL
jgi:phosphoribosylformimino-5-aminoimidazole carboxamide ribotide isomerase